MFIDLQETMSRLESLRHEPKTLSPNPVSGIDDYSTAGIAIEAAMQHLNEGIPNGQAERTRLALQLLENGFIAMKTWLWENEAQNRKSFNETKEQSK